MPRNLPDLWRRDILDPFREISRLQRTMDRLFSDILNNEGVPSSAQMQQIPQTAAFMPACDIEETEKSYMMKLDLPGLKKDDIRIELTEGQLTISGERKEEREEKKGDKGEKGSRYFYERSYGSFFRSFPVPSAIKSEQIRASYDDGVLTVEVPKVESSQSKRIMIEEGRKEPKRAA